MNLKIMLFSERLKLRPIEHSDLQSIHGLHSLPEVDKFNTLGIPKDIEETKLIMEPWVLDNQNWESANVTFSIELKDSLNFIGLIALKLGKSNYKNAEVWYKLHPYCWGKGFATEALKEIICFGFDRLQLHRIEAGCAVENKASIRVLEKAGMTREGRKREVLPLKSGWADNFEYAILEMDSKQ